MKIRYIPPTTKIIYFSSSRHLLIVGNSYNVNEYEDGGTIDIGGEEDEDNSYLPQNSQRLKW